LEDLLKKIPEFCAHDDVILHHGPGVV
jgi:hypothetical protein